MNIRNVSVIGAGIMGSGIAQTCASKSYKVNLFDVSSDALNAARQRIKMGFERGVKRGRIAQEEADNFMQQILFCEELETCVKDADLIIEAVYEDIDVKLQIIAEIDKYAPKEAIIASNTSALPITALADKTKDPGNFLGLHFMNPVPVMKGVEVIKGMETTETTMEYGKNFIRSLDKTPVEAVDYAGFIVTRILDAMMNEAVRCVMDGNSPEEIDQAMKLCANFPMGPCELIDLVGADILYNGLTTLKNEFGDRLHAAPLLRKMVDAGRLGRKTKKGFYNYDV